MSREMRFFTIGFIFVFTLIFAMAFTIVDNTFNAIEKQGGAAKVIGSGIKSINGFVDEVKKHSRGTK